MTKDTGSRSIFIPKIGRCYEYHLFAWNVWFWSRSYDVLEKVSFLRKQPAAHTESFSGRGRVRLHLLVVRHEVQRNRSAVRSVSIAALSLLSLWVFIFSICQSNLLSLWNTRCKILLQFKSVRRISNISPVFSSRHSQKLLIHPFFMNTWKCFIWLLQLSI